MINRTNAALLGLAVLSAVTGFWLSLSAITSPTEPEVLTVGFPDAPKADINVHGMQRPDFTLADIAGNVRNINEWDGRVVAINFWASWCSPCLQEIPELVDLQTRFGAQGLQVIGIALQKPEELVDFVRDYGMNYPVLAGESAVIAIAESYGNTFGALPYTAIIDRTGKVVFVKAGPVTHTEVESVIAPLL
jgi:peroxiredoxin